MMNGRVRKRKPRLRLEFIPIESSETIETSDPSKSYPHTSRHFRQPSPPSQHPPPSSSSLQPQRPSLSSSSLQTQYPPLLSLPPQHQSLLSLPLEPIKPSSRLSPL